MSMVFMGGPKSKLDSKKYTSQAPAAAAQSSYGDSVSRIECRSG